MNWPVCLLAILWMVHQNNYFGWNAKPQSTAELICDGIGFLLLAMAMMGWRR